MRLQRAYWAEESTVVTSGAREVVRTRSWWVFWNFILILEESHLLKVLNKEIHGQTDVLERSLRL